MTLNHNQMAYAAIISTLILGALFVGVSGFYQTSDGVGDFDSAAEEDLFGDEVTSGEATDSDGDGLPDVLEESQYGNKKDDPDTDKDGMSDGWEVEHGLNPLDNGESEDFEDESGTTSTADDAEISNESDFWKKIKYPNHNAFMPLPFETAGIDGFEKIEHWHVTACFDGTTAFTSKASLIKTYD